MSDELLCSVADGIATVTLNRPAKRNALNLALLDGLAASFARLEGAPAVRVVVVRGSGPAFCSGMDLDELSRQQKQTILRGLATREGIEHADLEKRKPVFRGE